MGKAGNTKQSLCLPWLEFQLEISQGCWSTSRHQETLNQFLKAKQVFECLESNMRFAPQKKTPSVSAIWNICKMDVQFLNLKITYRGHSEWIQYEAYEGDMCVTQGTVVRKKVEHHSLCLTLSSSLLPDYPFLLCPLICCMRDSRKLNVFFKCLNTNVVMSIQPSMMSALRTRWGGGKMVQWIGALVLQAWVWIPNTLLKS